MGTFPCSRHAVSFGVVALLLAACGGSQPPIVAPGAIPIRPASGASGSYQLLHTFSESELGEGLFPEVGLVEVDGTLYGTTFNGGRQTLCCGTAYSMTTSGVLTVLYRFYAPRRWRGAYPSSPLTDVSGTLYGATYYGGGKPCKCGTVYSIHTSGKEKTLYNFTGPGGADPHTSLLDLNGTLYGTAAAGGGTGCYNDGGCGTVYSITAGGAEKVLYSFAGGRDGAAPQNGLVRMSGTLYGTTAEGGGTGCSYHEGCGTVYSITTSGKEKVLHRFNSSHDGAEPVAGLVDVNGTLYGTTAQGGSARCVIVYNGLKQGCGTVFSITPSGKEKVLYEFAGGSDGSNPRASLIDVDGVLYGTTRNGGPGCTHNYGCGTVFSITTSGVETVLRAFAGSDNGDGEYPEAPLLDVGGALYGTTEEGGSNCGQTGNYCAGTIFALTPALLP